MSDRALEVLAAALPVDPDDGTMPIKYHDEDPAYSNASWSCTWGPPETVAEKQVTALQDAGFAVVDTRDEATVERAAKVLYGTNDSTYYRAPSWEEEPQEYRDLIRGDARAVLAELAKGDGDA